MRKPRFPGPPGDYQIGYCKPPKHTRLQPGKSGNPRGRPKADKSFDTVLQDAVNEKINVRRDGKARVISGRRALALRLVADAIQGKASAQKMLLARIERFPKIIDAPSAREADLTWLKENIELMRKRMQTKSPGEK